MKRQLWNRTLITIAVIALLCGCKQSPDKTGNADSFDLQIPEGFPQPVIPESNKLTKSRVELGKRLFYDKRLSQGESISCASCHQPQYAFADNTALSSGENGKFGFRNTPTLTNVAYQQNFMMDGGVPTLELQTLAPLHDQNEMGFDISRAADRLNSSSEMRKLSTLAYGRDTVDAFVITRALASFQRTLMSTNSSFDQFRYHGKSDAMTDKEIRGMNLFFGEKAQCGTCHTGANLTDGEFHNIGLYDNYGDPGRERISNKGIDRGKFKTPTLRNIALTGPYMHNGSIETLEKVIEHFDSGGVDHPNKSEKVIPLSLTQKEKNELLAFLKTLTDTDFVNNPDFHK